LSSGLLVASPLLLLLKTPSALASLPRPLTLTLLTLMILYQYLTILLHHHLDFHRPLSLSALLPSPLPIYHLFRTIPSGRRLSFHTCQASSAMILPKSLRDGGGTVIEGLCLPRRRGFACAALPGPSPLFIPTTTFSWHLHPSLLRDILPPSTIYMYVSPAGLNRTTLTLCRPLDLHDMRPMPGDDLWTRFCQLTGTTHLSKRSLGG